MIIDQRHRREARLGEETAPVSRFNVIIIQSRSRGGTDFCRCTERRNSRNSSARSTRDFRCRRSGERGGRRKGLLSLIYLEGSFATCSRYNFAIYSGQWRAATINISILLCRSPPTPDRKMRAPHGEHVSISSTCVTRRCTFIYVEKFRPIHFKTGEIGSEEKCSDKHLPLFPNKRIFLFSVENTLFLGARIKSSWNTNWPDDGKRPGWKPVVAELSGRVIVRRGINRSRSRNPLPIV